MSFLAIDFNVHIFFEFFFLSIDFNLHIFIEFFLFYRKKSLSEETRE
jgi:hypothetical protein